MLGRLKVEGDRVDAVPQPGGRGAIVEHVPQVRTTAIAVHLGADHAQASVPLGAHQLLNDVVRNVLKEC